MKFAAIDVSEITMFTEGKKPHFRSYKIGTILLLQSQISRETRHDMKGCIKKHFGNYDELVTIRNGGNIKNTKKEKQECLNPFILA